MTEATTPIDWAYLEHACGGDSALEAEVLELFVTQATQYLAALEAHIEDEDWPVQAHKLKGAARSIGARPLAELAANAEKAATGDRAGHHARLRAEAKRLENAISEKLSKNLP